MSRVLAVSQRQAQTLMRAAEAEEAIVEVLFGNTTIRLIPKCHASVGKPTLDEIPSNDAFSTLDDYRVWRKKTRDHRD